MHKYLAKFTLRSGDTSFQIDPPYRLIQEYEANYFYVKSVV